MKGSDGANSMSNYSQVSLLVLFSVSLYPHYNPNVLTDGGTKTLWALLQGYVSNPGLGHRSALLVLSMSSYSGSPSSDNLSCPSPARLGLEPPRG